jgi:hypothetical protein
MSNPDYVLTASLVLDAHHAADDPDDEGTCNVCHYAAGHRDDAYGHYTWASVDEAWDWTEATGDR